MAHSTIQDLPAPMTQVQRVVITADSSKSAREHNPRHKFEIDYVEQATQDLKEAINACCQQAGQSISLVSMRQLIGRYGLTAVRRAVKRVCARQDVENPPGLLTVILRSEARLAELKSG